MQGKPVAEQEIGKLLLLEPVSYAESSMCRRKSLLHYFGEEYTEENCGNCDNCCNPRPRINATEELATALEALRSIGDKFKIDHLIALLIGKTTAIIKSYGHNNSEFFGVGAEKSSNFWSAVIRQGLIMGLISKNIENYGLISITPAGAKFIDNPTTVRIAEDRDYDEEEDTKSAAPAHGGVADEELYGMLKDLR